LPTARTEIGLTAPPRLSGQADKRLQDGTVIAAALGQPLCQERQHLTGPCQQIPGLDFRPL
jgi:hypothetical protein